MSSGRSRIMFSKVATSCRAQPGKRHPPKSQFCVRTAGGWLLRAAAALQTLDGAERGAALFKEESTCGCGRFVSSRDTRCMLQWCGSGAAATTSQLPMRPLLLLLRRRRLNGGANIDNIAD